MRINVHRKTAGERNVIRHERNRERVHTRLAKGDLVRVLRGEDKGKEGRIIRVFLKKGRVTVEGVNIVKRHRKARRQEEQSGIIDMPAPIHLSNVMLLDAKSGSPTRVRMVVDADGNKERISVKSGDTVPRQR